MLTGNYWDGYLTLPFSVRDEPPAKVAMLGVAGGTVARAYAKYFPGTIIDAVEIDGELFDIGRRWFGLEDRPQLRVHADDARPFLRRTGERYDFIFLDTYRQPYIPFYLATKEFFELARERLAPGGAVIINVGHPEDSPRLEQVLTATMGAAFPHVARDAVRDTNTLLMGSTVAPSRARLAAAAARLPADLRPVALADARAARGPAGGRRPSTPTTRPRSSGSSTSRCSTTPAATVEGLRDRAADARGRECGRTRLASVRDPRRRRGDRERGRLRRRHEAPEHGSRARVDRDPRRRRARRLRLADREAPRVRARAAVASRAPDRRLAAALDAGRRARARQAGELPELSENEHAARALLEADGYERDWADWILEIRLEQEPDPPRLPPGYALREFVPGRDERAVHEVIDVAFGEWAEERGTFEDWAGETLGRPGFVPGHIATIVAGEQIVGVAANVQDVASIWVDQLAVARDHRGRGLARALLTHTFGFAWRAGLRRCELATDSRTGARGLYEHVGMRVKRTSWNYVKTL